MSVTERLVTRLARRFAAAPADTGPSRRGFLATTTLAGAALAVEPWAYLTRPASAYTSICGPGAACDEGWSAMCCTIRTDGKNLCPTNTFPGGWWKADKSSYCGGSARYYIDCNALPGHHFTCHCADAGTCDHRRVACNIFRYGQCNTQIAGTTAVVCRQISCRPPWEIYPGKCGKTSATDNATAEHNAPCLTKANTYPKLVTFPAAPSKLTSGHTLPSGGRLTSPDRHTTAEMLAAGSLIIRNQNGIVWSSHSAPAGENGHAFLHADGNLTINTPTGTTVWQTNTHGSGSGWYLVLTDSGKLIISNGSVHLWTTPTHTP